MTEVLRWINHLNRENMKKIIFSYTNFLVLVGLLIGCADETTHPWNGLVQEAATVIVDEVVVPVYDVTNLASAKFEAKLSSPTNNISKYDINVSLNGGDTVFVKSITSFPATLSVTAQEIATALQMNLEDLAPGDKVSFLAEVTRSDGTVFGVEDLDGDVNNPGMKQGYWFTTFVSCPLSPQMLQVHTR